MNSKAFGVLLGFSIGLPMIFIPLLIIFPNLVAGMFFAIVEGACIGFAQSIWQKQNNKISNVNNIEYCPRCKSENIKIYREGYDYEKGFWMRIANVKGGGYAAGFNRNRARCRCMNCGKDWKTNYDYRFLDK